MFALAGSVVATTTQVVIGANTLAANIATGGIAAGIAYMYDNIIHATTYSDPVLYSGGTNAFRAAQSYVAENGGTLINDTVIGKCASTLEKLFPKHGTVIWSKASELFCRHSSGLANAFISIDKYNGSESIFWKYEMSALTENLNIIEIIIKYFE